MRFLTHIALAIYCCLFVLQGRAADVPVKKAVHLTAYRAAAVTLPGEGLNDHYHSTAFHVRTAAAHKFYHEETACLNSCTDQRTTGFILNDSVHPLISEIHAKIFRNKLLFPQHYYW